MNDPVNYVDLWGLSASDANGQPLSPEDIAEIVESHPDYEPGDTIVILGCSTGDDSKIEGEDNYGQQVANNREDEGGVMAPDGGIWIESDGRVTFDDKDGGFEWFTKE